LFILVFPFLLAACRQEGGQTDVISVTEADGTELSPEDIAFMRKAFTTADACMNLDDYDSAQIWLNKIHEKVSYRNPSLFSYYLTSRQAEVYYYNNLVQLGLQEGQRALVIANSLNDNYLKADALNFCGLFLVNMDRTREAISYFREGIEMYPAEPVPSGYLPLTSPHHLYGNMSEAYGKLGQLDTAIFYANRSLIAAESVRNPRGVANALLNIGGYVLKKGYADSASSYFLLSREQAHQSGDFDIELTAIGSLAECAMDNNDMPGALRALQSGFDLMTGNTQLNSFYALFFLESAAKVYSESNAFEQLARTLAMRSEIQEATQLRNNRQYETIMMTGLRNETRILNLEITRAKHEQSLATTRSYLLILVFVLLAAGFIAYRYFTRQKLRLAVVRHKISQDLHDEIGSTLSGIAMYSYITRGQINDQQPDEVEKSLAIIEKNAIDMVKKLNDIVWVVNPGYDSLESLLLRLQEYAVETAAAKGIAIVMELDENSIRNVKLSMNERRNIYLLCKEAVNNSIKYSACTVIAMTAGVDDSVLGLTIADNGSGFDTAAENNKGNGIVNMAARAKELDARFELTSSPGNGTIVGLMCKITH